MDNPKKLTYVEWFFGYGGNYLGLRRAITGLQLIVICEREARAIANLVAKMEKGLLDAVPIWTNCEDFPILPFKNRTNFFAASYPCQGFSNSGKRLGEKDPRHLWPYCRRFIQGARPDWIWLENVEGHITVGLRTVLSDLEEDGYEATWGIFSASEVGAPHHRKRVFILAYDRRKSGFLPITGEQPAEQMLRGYGKAWRTWQSWPIESTIHGDIHGPSDRVDRLRLCGNGVVPQTAELAFRTLYKELTE